MVAHDEVRVEASMPAHGSRPRSRVDVLGSEAVAVRECLVEASDRRKRLFAKCEVRGNQRPRCDEHSRRDLEPIRTGDGCELVVSRVVSNDRASEESEIVGGLERRSDSLDKIVWDVTVVVRVGDKPADRGLPTAVPRTGYAR